jgi:flavodoxin
MDKSTHVTTPRLGRRHLLRFGAAGIASAAFGSSLANCTSAPKNGGSAANEVPVGARAPSQSDDARAAVSSGTSVLVVFFSRAGENYFNGGRINLEVGNTEVAVRMIQAALACDVYQIQPSEPYPDSYEATVQRNVREQSADARPAIASPLTSIDSYDTILIGSPVWNVRAPRIMLTFAERFDFTGRTVYPFTTYAVSGLGDVVEEYTTSFRGAIMGEALAIRGEEVNSSRPQVEQWLRRIGLLA